jgi:hypothetical protein
MLAEKQAINDGQRTMNNGLFIVYRLTFIVISFGGKNGTSRIPTTDQ